MQGPEDPTLTEEGDDLLGAGPPGISRSILPPEWAMEGPEDPTLTEEEVARAKEILASDPRTQALPSGWSIQDDRVVPWTNEQYEKIGAGMTILLAEPLPVAAVKGSWSYVKYDDPSAPHGYRVVTDEKFTQEDIQRLAGYEVRSFSVRVDFERGEVVHFWPAYGRPWTWSGEGGTPTATSSEVPAPPAGVDPQD
jgi:hypothetical protein